MRVLLVILEVNHVFLRGLTNPLESTLPPLRNVQSDKQSKASASSSLSWFEDSDEVDTE